MSGCRRCDPVTTLHELVRISQADSALEADCAFGPEMGTQRPAQLISARPRQRLCYLRAPVLGEQINPIIQSGQQARTSGAVCMVRGHRGFGAMSFRINVQSNDFRRSKRRPSSDSSKSRLELSAPREEKCRASLIESQKWSITIEVEHGILANAHNAPGGGEDRYSVDAGNWRGRRNCFRADRSLSGRVFAFNLHTASAPSETAFRKALRLRNATCFDTDMGAGSA